MRWKQLADAAEAQMQELWRQRDDYFALPYVHDETEFKILRAQCGYMKTYVRLLQIKTRALAVLRKNGDADASGNGAPWENEPRVPAGQPGGGQWTTGGGGSADSFANPNGNNLGPGTQYADSGQIMNDAGINNGDILGYPDGSPIIDPNTNTPYPAPPGLNIPNNVAAGSSANALDMYDWFSHGGPMDYQRTDGVFNGDYTHVTNYNYGVVSAAAGYSLDDALTNAGLYNRILGHATNQDTAYGITQNSVNNITQGWNDYGSVWSK